MCDLTNIQKFLREIEELKAELKEQKVKTNQIENEIGRIIKSENSLFDDVAELLRKTTQTNFDFSKLLNEMSETMAELAFKIRELEKWKSRAHGVDVSFVATHRANQLKMAYTALKDGFNDNELLELVLDLQIPLNEVSGDSVAEKAMWLVEYTRNHRLFWTLVKRARQLRPYGLWPSETGGLPDVH